MIEEVLIPSRQLGERIQLEGRLHIPKKRSKGRAAVICHPDPRGGGAMDTPLILSLAEKMNNAQLLTLRFNFRGGGGSQGRFSGGDEEWEDVRAAVAFLAERGEVSESSIDLVGWSFGAAMCLRAGARGLFPRSLILISLPLLMILEGEINRLASGARFPVNFVVGISDQLCPMAGLHELAGKLNLDVDEVIKVIPGADHFLLGREKEVAEIVLKIADTQTPGTS